MRVQNSLRNIFFGISGQLISALMGFIVRTIFIYTLGIEYLGIEGLFSSILMMLSLANLGFDTAIIYSLYKPLAEKNIYQIQAMMNLYKKAYRLIGLVVLLIGISVMPFLHTLITGVPQINNINLIYLLFLLNAVSSYYFAYKQAIIIADQQNHIISRIHSIFIIFSNLTLIICLLIFKNYIVILMVQIVFRIFENIYISKKTDKLYPYLRENHKAKLSIKERKSFFENLYSLLLYRISGVVINGTDNIVISKFVGIKWVGVYSNYLLIISTIETFLSYLFFSIKASIGNLYVNENVEKQYFFFRVLNFANFWIYGFFAVFIWNLINPLIILWLGENFIFNKYILFAIILNFFTSGMQNASTTFREVTGLFKKGKYSPIIAATINIAASIVLVQKIGITGVLLGTVISRLSIYFWYDPYIIFKFAFQRSVKSYFFRYTLYVILVFVSALITDSIGGAVYNNNSPMNIAFRGFLCLIIPNSIFFMVFKNHEEFRYLKDIVILLIHKMFFRVFGKSSQYIKGFVKEK